MDGNDDRLHAGEFAGMSLMQGNDGEIQSHDRRKRQNLPAELTSLQIAVSTCLHGIKFPLRITTTTSNPQPSLTWVKLASGLYRIPACNLRRVAGRARKPAEMCQPRCTRLEVQPAVLKRRQREKITGIRIVQERNNTATRIRDCDSFIPVAFRLGLSAGTQTKKAYTWSAASLAFDGSPHETVLSAASQNATPLSLSTNSDVGKPFNIACCALQTMMMAQVTGLFAFTYEDFKLEGYDPHPAISAPIAV